MKEESLEEKVIRLERDNAALLAALKHRNVEHMTVKLLVAAGHVGEGLVEKARDLARGLE